MTNTYTEHPDQAWQIVLSQLQTEMPRGSFNTWVRDTKAISYKDSRLTIGVQNAYQRDFLESRVQKTASRLLVGVLGAHAEVEFVLDAAEVVEDEDRDVVETEEEEIAFSGLHPANTTRYQEEVKPQRIVMFPAYTLRHLVQGEVTHKDLSSWMSARQAVYFPWKRNGGGASFRQHISWREITRFAGMSKNSFFRTIQGRDEIANGMLRRLPETEIALDAANHWEVAMNPFITRHDASVLINILEANLAFDDNDRKRYEIALSVLTDLTQRSPAEYLETETEASEHPPKHIVGILRQVLGIEGDMPTALFEASEALEEKLINAYGKVVITHHFLTEVVPFFELTQAQTWAIIALNDRCVYDYKTGIEHDFLKADQGLETLAAWAGVSVKSMRRWLKMPKFRQFIRSYPDEIPNILNRNISNLKRWQEAGGLFFQVRQAEPPLAYIHDEAGDLIPIWRRSDFPLRQESELKNVCTLNAGTKWVTLRDNLGQGLGQGGAGSGTEWVMPLDKVGQGSGQDGSPLNNLFKPLQTSVKPLKPLQTTPQQKTSPAAQSGGWGMPALLELNPVSDPKLKARLLSQGDPNAFASWLIYGYSQDGHGLKSPVNHAISKLAKNPYQGAGQRYAKLAQLGPDLIQALMHKRLSPYAENDVDISDEFKHIFKPFSEENIHALAHSLFSSSWEEP
ncbi:MAG: hypothetical protein HN975_01490 [Anaerolineae bacterium]|jgi:hypothetical protein|nr:hypothetical protein [Anaerolineae bacterium]